MTVQSTHYRNISFKATLSNRNPEIRSSLGNSFESLGLFDIVSYKDIPFLQAPEMKRPRQLDASSNKLFESLYAYDWYDPEDENVDLQLMY